MNKALLVGINKYRYAPLRGCVNDAKNIYSLLTDYFSFKQDDIRVLFDERATKAGIIKRLRNLVTGAKEGDHLFFSFSGHGSQVRDRDGDEKLLDQMDEILCPYDIDFDNTYITDDELYNIFSKLPAGVKLTVILDCCHSGTGLRKAKQLEGGLSEVVSRYLAPPLDLLMRFQGRNLKSKPLKITKDKQLDIDYTLWSGCRSDQTSADANFGEGIGYAGVFSKTFCDLVRFTEGDISREVLLDKARETISGYGLSQIPQLETGDAQGSVLT